MEPVFILLSGAPGVGKTLLGKYISVQLQIPLFSKDLFQESLFRLGHVDSSTVDGYEIMYDIAMETLTNGQGCVVDAVFPKESLRSRFIESANEITQMVLPLYVHCSDVKEWEARYRAKEKSTFANFYSWEQVLVYENNCDSWEKNKYITIDTSESLKFQMSVIRKELSNKKESFYDFGKALA